MISTFGISIMASNTATRFTCKYESCPLLGAGNYTEWSLNVWMLLRGAHALSIVDGTEPVPAAAVALRDYDKPKDTAALLLWNSLTPAAQQLVAATEEPHGMWTALKDRLDITMNNVAAARIRRHFNVEHWNDGDTLSSWYSRLLSYQNRLTGSQWEVSNKENAMILLMGLPSNWSTVREQIMSSQPQLELWSVIGALESNSKIVAQNTMHVNTANGTGNTEALISIVGIQEKPNQRRGNCNNRDNDNRECYNCGRKGHIARNCSQWERDHSHK